MYLNTDTFSLHAEVTLVYKKRLHKQASCKRASSKKDASTDAQIEVPWEHHGKGKERYPIRGNGYTNCHHGCCQVVAQCSRV